MAKILGTSIGKTSSIIFLVLVVFISLALSNVSFLVSNTVAGPPLRLEGMREGADGKHKKNKNGDNSGDE
jgi:hypothetical protein